MKPRSYSKSSPLPSSVLSLFLLASLIAGCGSPEPSPAASQAPDNGIIHLTAWAHAGREAERDTLVQQVDRFNDRNDDIEVELVLLPEGSYNSQVQSAALGGDLPDLLEFDGPYVYSYAWSDQLQPIGNLISTQSLANLLPSIVQQGTYRGELYSIGTFDSGLALWADRSRLTQLQAPIPTHPGQAWSVDEFEAILASLAADDPDGKVLDLKLNYSGEWFTYGFSPALGSASGGLIQNNPSPPKAAGTLDSPASIAAMQRLQDWIAEQEWVDENIDDRAFIDRRVAFSWVGHWEYDRYKAALGDDLILIPLPNFGSSMKTAQGSWNWGISARCSHSAAAAHFLEFLLEDQQVIEMVNANGAVPGTRTAIDQLDRYREGGELNLYTIQLEGGWSVPRPRTPAYPVITSIFQQAFDDIRHGADVAETLAEAARDIDRDIDDNDGYRPSNQSP